MNIELKVLRKMLDAVENKGFDKMCAGMCHLLQELFQGGVISFSDKVHTQLYLGDNTPKGRSTGTFWWKRYCWPVRITWIKQHIKKLEDGVR